MRIGIGLAALTLVTFAPTRADAQETLIEFGVDGALEITVQDPRVTTIGIPIQQLRVGFFTSPTLSWEPTLALNYLAVQGAGDFSRVTLGLGLLFHLSPVRTRTQTYLRPFVGFTSVSPGGDDNPNLGFGVGFKMPWQNRRFATRVEGFLNHVFADPDGVTSVGVLFGVSFFNR